jgi:hypothetical protein
VHERGHAHRPRRTNLLHRFDRFRERSSIGRVIDTSRERRTVHTVGTLTEFSMYAVKRRGATSWSASHAGRYTFVHDLDAIEANAARAEGETYVDVHNWVFSPHHLRLMLLDLQVLGLISVREAAFQDTIPKAVTALLAQIDPDPILARSKKILTDYERAWADFARTHSDLSNLTPAEVWDTYFKQAFKERLDEWTKSEG